jgi:hypothetical protein
VVIHLTYTPRHWWTPSLAIPSPASPKHAPPVSSAGTLHNYDIISLLVLVSSNHTITYNTRAFSITAKALSITATATGKVYGVADSIPHLHRHRWTYQLAIPSPASPKHAPPPKAAAFRHNYPSAAVGVGLF